MPSPTSTARPSDRHGAGLVPRPGPGALQWSAGGFIGSVFGLTLWMLLAGLLLVLGDPPRGLAVVGVTLTVVAVAVALWRARARLAPHTALQVLLLVGLAAAAATLALVRASLGEEVAAELGDGRPLWAYLGIFPLLMVALWWLDRQGRPPADAA